MFKFWYVVWLMFPLCFFLIALWSKLEALGGKSRKENPGDIMRQGFFLLICALVCIGFDHYLLPGLYEYIESDWLPYGLLQFMLFPAVLYLAAVTIGPSVDIRITRAPSPTRSKSNIKRP